MATLDNAAIVREIYSKWNAKDLDGVASYGAPDARITLVPFGSKLSYREYEEGWARGFPDGQIKVVNMVAQGEWVVSEFNGRGTQTGPFRTPAGEVPATGRKVDMSFVEILRVKNGKVLEGRMYFDAATLMAQLGVGATSAQRPGTSAEAPRPRH